MSWTKVKLEKMRRLMEIAIAEWRRQKSGRQIERRGLEGFYTATEIRVHWVLVGLSIK